MVRKLPLIVCFISGLIMFLQFFVAHAISSKLNQTFLEYWQIIFAFALILGVVGYINRNVTQLKYKEDRFIKITGLVGMLSMPIFALIWGIKADTPFIWVFENIQAPMQSTVFALLAFFVASASFRGFKARSLPAAILLGSAVIILLSRSNIGGIFSDYLPEIADWIRNYPAMSARRAILIGIGLGSLTTSLRVILGIERTWLGGDK